MAGTTPHIARSFKCMCIISVCVYTCKESLLVQTSKHRDKHVSISPFIWYKLVVSNASGINCTHCCGQLDNQILVLLDILVCVVFVCPRASRVRVGSEIRLRDATTAKFGYTGKGYMCKHF